MKRPIVDVAIVTYNRLAKLQRALDCYDKQTVTFRTLIVVDNNSTDGTKEFLEQWKKEPSAYEKHVIYLPNNVGGSGGFYEGEKYALSLNPDWVYISDDDAYLDPDVMEIFYKFQSQHTEEKVSVISTSVTYGDRVTIFGHRCHISVEQNQFIKQAATEDDYQKPYFECNGISYVGVFLSAQALREVGLVNKDFFIYQDDTEHSIRLAKYGKMYCVPSMIVVHDTMPMSDTDQSSLNMIFWKEYYSYRNWMYMLLTHYPKIGRKTLLKALTNIKTHRKSNMSSLVKMELQGYYDAWRGKLGIHDVYRPGLVITKDVNNELPYPEKLWNVLYFALRIIRIFA